MRIHIKINFKTYGYKIFAINRIYDVDMDLENQYMLQQLAQVNNDKQRNNNVRDKENSTIQKEGQSYFH